MNDVSQAEDYLKSLTVLYVEDEDEAREQFTRFLNRLVGVLITAKDGAEGVAAYHAHHPQLVITDIQMPNLDGLAMCHEIRKADESVPFIILTAHEQIDYLRESINLHVDRYLTKPVEGMKLYEILLDCALHLGKDAALQSAACSDPLTGLANRRALADRFMEEKNKAERHGTPISLVIADIDHFKLVNDSYGHQAGDIILKAVAQAFRMSLRKEDICGRWGGEEFLIILPSTTGEAAMQVAEKLRIAVGELVTRWERENLMVTVSLGVAPFRPGMMLEDCVRHADEALYRAKSGGRNKVELAASFS